MTTSSKVRLYDLAKELKLDTGHLISEVRQQGVSVSVASNSISKELAQRLRSKYLPKHKSAGTRVVKLKKDLLNVRTPALLQSKNRMTSAPKIGLSTVKSAIRNGNQNRDSTGIC